MEKRRIKRVLIINGLILLVAVILLSLEKLGYLHTICLTNYLFGVYCPGCGLSRLCRAVLAGDFYQAFRYNPLIFILIPVFAVMYIFETVKYLLTGRLSSKLNYILIALAIIIEVYGVIRNFPILGFLAPVQL